MTRFYNPQENSPETLEPVDRMMDLMRLSGIKTFDNPGTWEVCLCALVLSLDPKCRTYHFMQSLPFQDTPYSVVDVMNSLAHLGYFSRCIRTDMSQIDPRLYPSLFIDENDTPTILIEKDDGRVKIFRNGNILYLQESQLSKEQGSVYLFERYDENKPSTSRFVRESTDYSWFRALFTRFRGTLLQILSAGFILNIISLVTPLFVMLIYNRVVATATLSILPMIMVGMIMAIGFEFALRTIRSRGLSWIAARMDNIVGNRIFAHLVGLPPELIERASVSSQIARVRTFESIRDFFCGSVFLSIIEVPFVALAALAIYLIAGPLVLVPIMISTLYLVLFYAIYKRVKMTIRVAAKASSAKQQFTIETFEKIRAIRSYGLSGLWEGKFRDLSGKETMAQFQLSWLGMVGETLSHGLTLLAAVATIGFGAHLIWVGTISTGALVATMILVWRILTPFYSVCTIIPRLEQLRNSIIQVNKLMDIETEMQAARQSSRLSKIRGDISFKDVSLRYIEGGETVFSNLSFDAKFGDLVVITGENGAGKSSILKLVKGLYRPLSGSVQIDGFDIRQLDAPDLRRQIAYIPQQGDFFDGTIISNMRLANPIASLSDIEQALDLATALNDIRQLPNGLETSINRYNAQILPANLGLKISLARLYLHAAPILLIDEVPNVLLSGNAGQNLRDYLARIKGKRTCLMITYREDMMRMADTLVLMRNGETPLCGQSSLILKSMTEAA